MAWVKVKAGKEGVATKEVEVKVLTVSEFFRISKLAKELEQAEEITEEKFKAILRDFQQYIKGIGEDDELVVVMDAIQKLIQTNTISYEEYKKKSATSSSQGGQRR